MRPGPKDWLWPIVCGFFMLIELVAVVIGHFRPPAIGLEAILFLLTMIGIFNLWEKLHFKRKDDVPADIRALGGPILVQRMSALYGFGGLLAVCGALALSGGAPEFRLLANANARVVEVAWMAWTIGAAAVTGFGIWLLLSAFLGRTGHLYLVFEPTGLRVGTRRYSYLIHWDNLAGIKSMVRARNTWLVLAPADTGRVLATLKTSSGDDATYRAKLASALASPGDRINSPLAVMPRLFGVDAGIFARAVNGYAADPSRCTLDLDPAPAPAQQ